MSTRTTLDSGGRILIPKGLRSVLRLEAGDEFDLEVAGEQITLRPVRETPPLTKEQGVWVFRAGKPLSASTASEILRSAREDRDRGNLEPSR